MDRLLQALQPLLAPAFSLWGSPVTWVEMLAFVLSLAMVVCNIRVNVMAWPLAIVASLLYCLLFWDSRLYGEAGLQVFFVAVAGWGWWQWLRGREADGSALRVRFLSGRARLGLLAAVAVAWPLLGAFLRQAYVENWPVWVAVNAVSVGLFAWKGLWLTVLLYLLFLGMALWGWRAWQQLARRHG
ncbi:MAG: nicotinamide mononucleotide transporter family protein [Burkholderiaceae bacterium]|nr:nicotinamide mononucleotide transporter family protein [Burkholderiaceae bacterium]